MKYKNFNSFAWFVLAYNQAVILWGAFVRATGSGAGCGRHWPLCNGEVVPRAPQTETIIEFTHRLTSGIAFLLVLAMLIWARRLFPSKHRVRQAAGWAMVFMISESLVGAGLVLFECVGGNISVARVIVMSVHLLNTHALLAAIILCVWWAKTNQFPRSTSRIPLALILALISVLILSMAGAVTALGDTLFPSDSLSEGIAQDLDPTSHFLVRLRVIHPVIAIVVGLYLAFVSGNYLMSSPKGSQMHRLALVLVVLYAIQLAAGLINLLLLAPVWMQIVHLLLADLVWIFLILLVNESIMLQDIGRENE
jgi:heme A synthase